jgi:hypothetical protein
MKFTFDTAGQSAAERRRDELIAFRVEVALIFLEMLGEQDAREYLDRHNVPPYIVEHVLEGLDGQTAQRELDEGAGAHSEGSQPP